MPISRKQFENGEFKSRYYGEEEDYVLAFLKKNKDKAYRPEELAKVLKKSGSIIRQKLRKLIKQGLVERTIPYYILAQKKKVSPKNKKKK